MEADMGGSGSSGGFSSSEAEQVQRAAEARLKAIASKSTKVLFVCEAIDMKSLESHLARSRVFTEDRTIVIDSGRANQIDAALDRATFLVAFTNEAKVTQFIDSVIDKALAKTISGVHVKAQPKSLAPSKATAYRWRSLTWEELEAIFSA
jgi:hypothetical protein